MSMCVLTKTVFLIDKSVIIRFFSRSLYYFIIHFMVKLNRFRIYTLFRVNNTVTLSVLFTAKEANRVVIN